MNYPIDTPTQARAVLRALRHGRGLSQAQVGQLLGVSQKRVARIESAPDRTSFDQIAKLVAILGGRVVIEDTGPTVPKKQKPGRAGW
jgi:HTH-type transcriptional regulator/antitoxin HipB